MRPQLGQRAAGGSGGSDTPRITIFSIDQPAIQDTSIDIVLSSLSCRRFLFRDGHGLPVKGTRENVVCPMECQSAGRLRKGRILHSWWKVNTLGLVDGFKSLGRLSNCSLMVPPRRSKPLDFPFSLETLVPLNAHKNNTIVLAAAGYSYKDMLMSWVCRLRQLQITNFIICALDKEIYEFAVLQEVSIFTLCEVSGLPVFRDPLAPSEISSDCHFGTKCFQKVTKVKSRMVLKILTLGYNVLLRDVDVYWFGNPLPLLYSLCPAILVVQSDEFNTTGPINVPRRLNSGFYFARPGSSTINAMKKVVAHAPTSGLSEQPLLRHAMWRRGFQSCG